MNKEEQTDPLIEPVGENPLEKDIPENNPKKKPMMVLISAGVIVLIMGFFVIRTILPKNEQKTATNEEQTIEQTLNEVDASVHVDLVKSRTKDNTVVITVTGLGANYVSVGYELQYESGGVGKGVTSGSKPLDVTGQDSFEREIYMGTCSKNVCKPDLGVTKVSIVLEFTAKDGKKSQFSKDYDL